MAKRFFKRSGFIASQQTDEVIGSWWEVNNRLGFHTESQGVQTFLNKLKREGMKPLFEGDGRARIPFGKIPLGIVQQIMGTQGYTMVEQSLAREFQEETNTFEPRFVKGDRRRWSRETKFYIMRSSDFQLVGKLQYQATPVFRDIRDPALQRLVDKWRRSGITIWRPSRDIRVGRTREKKITSIPQQREKLDFRTISWHDLNRVLMPEGYEVIPAGVVEVWEKFKEKEPTTVSGNL